MPLQIIIIIITMIMAIIIQDRRDGYLFQKAYGRGAFFVCPSVAVSKQFSYKKKNSTD